MESAAIGGALDATGAPGAPTPQARATQRVLFSFFVNDRGVVSAQLTACFEASASLCQGGVRVCGCGVRAGGRLGPGADQVRAHLTLDTCQ